MSELEIHMAKIAKILQKKITIIICCLSTLDVSEFYDLDKLASSIRTETGKSKIIVMMQTLPFFIEHHCSKTQESAWSC